MTEEKENWIEECGKWKTLCIMRSRELAKVKEELAKVKEELAKVKAAPLIDKQGNCL